jgi:hypothetical protein
MKQSFISLLIALFPLFTFGQADLGDPKQCASGATSLESCWTIIDYPNQQRFVGFVVAGKPQGEGILYWSNGFIDQSGIWNSGNLTKKVSWNKSRFPFDNSPSGQATRAFQEELDRKNEEIERKNAEFERNRPPQQKIAFCVQTVQSSGTRYPFCYRIYSNLYY